MVMGTLWEHISSIRVVSDGLTPAQYRLKYFKAKNKSGLKPLLFSDN